ncbi:MAG: cyclic pyranopterin phosphate synthase, partial [Rhodococcus sp. (in: high G+C Gram-positive bacteria)]
MTVVSMGIPTVRGDTGSHSGRPESDFLVDRFGRVARDLRVSIAEKCSLRCTYCMPEEGLEAIASQDLLSVEEIVRVVGVGVDLVGIREVRFTGGEPLMRSDLESI